MRTVTGQLATMDVKQVVINLDYQCGWNRYLMKIIGIWPEERKWNQPSSYVILLPFITMLCFLWGPQTVNLPLIIHDLDLVVENLSLANMTFTIALTKAIIFWRKGEALRSLLNCMANDWDTVEDGSERERMEYIAKMNRTVTACCMTLSYMVIISYTLVRLIFMKCNDCKLFIRGYFPYDTTTSPNYEVTMIGQAIALTCSATFYSTVDTFITMLILHICGQLSNLKQNIMNIYSTDKNDVHTKLKKIVQRHEYVNRFSETVEDCFNMMLLIQMLGFIFQICFQTFQVITSFEEEVGPCTIFQSVFFCIYIVCVLVQLFLYCYVGEKLTYESLDISDTAYNCEWYSLPPKNARLLMIIMCRAVASPLKLTAGKFCWFTILLYSQVVKTAVSYISVLYATKG